MYVNTPFAAYSHQELYAMLHAGDEPTARTAANSWDAVGARLGEQASNLEGKLTEFRKDWKGGAAEQYQIMVGDLATGLRRIAEAALRMRDLTHDAADALVKAKQEMPPPVAVPQVPEATMRMATTPLTVNPFLPHAQVYDLQQQQADAVRAVREQQEAEAAADAAHAKAVAVMTELAGQYQAADRAIPRTPTGANAPDVPQGPGSPDQGALGGLQTGDLEQPTGKPVFGNMFTAGIAAAAAASTGRLGIPLLPRVPPWAKKPAQKDKKEAVKPTPLAGKGFGGGGGSFGGGAPAATPQAGLVGGQAGPAAAASALRAAAGAAGAAGSGLGTGMPMMPFMPFAPGGGDMAGARRIPPWLTETEEVWGESATITPPVVGEDATAEQNPPGGYRF